MPRLFLGQSFQVVLSTFIISQLTTFSLWENDGSAVSLLAQSGFAGVIVVVNISQLLPSLIAQRYPAPFLNRVPLVYTAIRLALAIESIGIVETTYIIVNIFDCFFFNRSTKSLASTEDNSSKEEQRDVIHQSLQERFLTIRAFKTLVSLLLFLSSASFLLYNIITNKSSMNMIPPYVLLLITLLVYLLVFYCEGLKIAIVSTCILSIDQQQALGYNTKIKTTLSNGEDCVGRFLLGRQMIVVPLGFLIASITRFHSNIYNDMPSFFYFLIIQLNLPSMLVMMQLAQLAPQVLANKHLKQFLNLIGSNLLVLIALHIEVLGLTQASYVFRVFIERTCFCNTSNQFDPLPETDNDESIDNKKIAIAM
jgi:hypothetical protein